MTTNAFKILRSLIREPKTCREVSVDTGIRPTTVYWWVAKLRKDGEIYTGGWKRHGQGQFVALLHAGQGADVPCRLVAKTKAQIDFDYIERMKKSGEIHHYKARRNGRLHANRTVKRAIPATWLAALPGAMG